MREKKTHDLKIWPEFYCQVANGECSHQLRKDDRDYQVGDDLRLEEFDPKLGLYCGHVCVVNVTGALRNFEGLMSGYVLLSIKLMPDSYRYAPPRVQQ